MGLVSGGGSSDLGTLHQVGVAWFEMQRGLSLRPKSPVIYSNFLPLPAHHSTPGETL